MSIALRGAGAFAEENDGSTNVAYPAGIQAGDVLLLLMSLQTPSGSGSITAPSGWTLVDSISSNSSTPLMTVYRKIATGSESGSLTITYTSGTPNFAAQILAFSGVDNTTPLDVTNGRIDSTSSTTSTVIPGVTVATDQAALVACAANNTTNSTATPPSGFTETGDRSSGNRSFEISYKLANGTGATGNQIVTWSSSSRSIGFLIALRPASDAPPASGWNIIGEGGTLIPVTPHVIT